MNRKAVTFFLVIVFIFGSIFLSIRLIKAQEASPAQIGDISGQLQQIIQNQRLIISKLNDMAEELKIIKIRSTMKR